MACLSVRDTAVGLVLCGGAGSCARAAATAMPKSKVARMQLRTYLVFQLVPPVLVMRASSFCGFDVRAAARPPHCKKFTRNGGTRLVAVARLRSPGDSQKRVRWNRRLRRQSARWHQKSEHANCLAATAESEREWRDRSGCRGWLHRR